MTTRLQHFYTKHQLHIDERARSRYFSLSAHKYSDTCKGHSRWNMPRKSLSVLQEVVSGELLYTVVFRQPWFVYHFFVFLEYSPQAMLAEICEVRESETLIHAGRQHQGTWVAVSYLFQELSINSVDSSAQTARVLLHIYQEWGWKYSDRTKRQVIIHSLIQKTTIVDISRCTDRYVTPSSMRR